MVRRAVVFIHRKVPIHPCVASGVQCSADIVSVFFRKAPDPFGFYTAFCAEAASLARNLQLTVPSVSYGAYLAEMVSGVPMIGYSVAVSAVFSAENIFRPLEQPFTAMIVTKNFNIEPLKLIIKVSYIFAFLLRRIQTGFPTSDCAEARFER